MPSATLTIKDNSTALGIILPEKFLRDNATERKPIERTLKTQRVATVEELSTQTEETSKTDELGTSKISELINFLVNAPSKWINRLFDLVRLTASSEDILRASLLHYRHTGRERYLSMTLSLLQDKGEKAWPALSSFAKSGAPECELFIPLIASCPGISANERIRALTSLVRSTDVNVRRSLLNCFTDLSTDYATTILTLLASDSDEDVRQKAQEYLDSFRDRTDRS